MSRDTILWSGGLPTPEAVSLCEKRDLAMVAVDAEPSGDALARAKGLILRWPKEINASVAAALRHGATPVVLCDFADIPDAGRAIDGLGAKDGKSFVFIDSGAEQAVRRICREDDTAAWNPDVEVVGGDKLDDEEELLLRRAFADCNRVQLFPLLGGSGGVFQAYARLSDSRAGPVAMPFFVKFGRRAGIVRELRNYRECTTLHIPFNQRPNVDPARCALGFKWGIIVGNFVERSESLQSAADRGVALAPLQSLFSSALRGWRQQAHLENSIASEVLAVYMRRCLPSAYNPTRRDRLERHAEIARKDFSATMTLKALEQRLRALPAIEFRYAIAHNDLHGDNVRVTGQDAIMIDFAWTDYGPLSADPASLDISLVLNTDVVHGQDWEALARSFYGLNNLMRAPPPCSPENKGAQIADAVRFIRQIALPDTIDPLEYPIAMTLQLLRKASYPEKPHRRALAYALAEKLTMDIEKAFRIRGVLGPGPDAS
jgi:Phosphotransferase enzyme family